MVRVIKSKEDSSRQYELGNAFGELDPNDPLSPTERVMQTLDSMNLPSSSIRRTGATRSGGTLSTRSSSSLYHQLNSSAREYFNGSHGDQFFSRLDNEPGTKIRTELSPTAENKTFYHRTQRQHTHHTLQKSRQAHASHNASS